jgi:hypothetical protein
MAHNHARSGDDEARLRPMRTLRRVVLAALAVAAVLVAPLPAWGGNATHFDFVHFVAGGTPQIPRDGVPWTEVAIIALDATGQEDDCFDHTVTYSDPDSMVTPSHKFGSFHIIFCPVLGAVDFTFSITPMRPGPHRLTVTDINNPSVRSVIAFDVAPGPARSFELVPSRPSAVLGDGATFTLIARDSLGFQVTDDSNRFYVTTNDGAAIVPSDAALSGGSTTFAVKFGTVGTQSITVTDRDDPTLTATASVSVLKAPHFDIQMMISGTIEAGLPTQILFCAVNDDGSTDTGYRGTVHWTSSDQNADLPIDFALTSTHRGCTSPSVTFTKAGAQTLTLTDTANAAITGTAAFTISGGDATRLAFAGVPSTALAGPLTVTVNVFDAWDNPASSAHVNFACDDPSPSTVVPGMSSFRLDDHGTRQFQFTLPTARVTTCTATSAYVGAAFSESFSVNVVAGGGGGAHFYVSELASPRRPGVPGSVRVTVADGYGNRMASYRSRVHFTSTDRRASLPADYTFTAADAGSHVFTRAVILRSTGRQSITASDVHTPKIKGSQSGIVVTTRRPDSIVTAVLPGPE